MGEVLAERPANQGVEPQQQGIRRGQSAEAPRNSNGEINRELTTLKRILNLARQNGKLMRVPYSPMLKERNVRTGFFEQIERILAHLPAAIRPAVQFAYITGWRIPSEVLKLQWRHVDFEARVVRLDPHTTKNDEGRTFPFTDGLEQLLEAQKVEHERLKADGVICPWVFNRSNRKVKGKRITTFIKAFRAACTKAGCPGGIPHDLRRTAARNLARRRPRARRHADDRAQDTLGIRALQHRERVRPRRGREEAEHVSACLASFRP